jgi:hypothetical protein
MLVKDKINGRLLFQDTFLSSKAKTKVTSEVL